MRAKLLIIAAATMAFPLWHRLHNKIAMAAGVSRLQVGL
jgi:hypothetical protein